MTVSLAGDLASIAEGVGDIDDLPIIDVDRLATFTDGNQEVESELADLFLATAQRYLADMRTALEEERSWSASAHALKGAGGNLGARRVAALAKGAEAEAPSSAWLQVLQLAVDDVAAQFAERAGS